LVFFIETVKTIRYFFGLTIAFSISALLAVSTGLKAAENQDSLGKQLGPITAKIVSDNQAAEKELNLLARVEVRPNEIIEFYEPAPGRIIISGAGTPQLLARFQAAARTPIQAWRLVAPDAEMPVALREAVERSERRKGVQRSERSEQREGVQRKDTAKRRSSWGEGSSARNFSPASGGFCDTGYYEGGWDSCEDFYNYRVCLTNWRDGVFAYHHDAFNVWTQSVRQPERLRFG
jgi:hypothetical protein